MTRIRVATLGFVAVSALSWALPVPAARDAKPVTVRVKAGQPSEYAYVLTPRTVKRGKVTFLVVNGGQKPHDFKIAGKKTPILAPGKSARLAVTLAKPGSYTYFCTVPGHAVAGMKGVLKVA